MKFNSLTPNLMVADIEDTIEFYESKLGFTVLNIMPEKGNPDWCMLKHNDVVVMFQSKKSFSGEKPLFKDKNPGGGFTLYIKVEGVHELYYDLVEKTEIISELEDTFYGTTEFSITDLNGYVLTFSEERNK